MKKTESTIRRTPGEPDREHIRHEFESWFEFVNYVNTAKRPGASTGQSHKNYSTSYPDGGLDGNNYWAGAVSWDEAINLAKTGWTHGAAQIKTTLRDLRILGKKPVMRTAMSRVGPGTLDMGRYLTGHPAPYRIMKATDQMTETEIRKGVVHLCINVSQSSGIPASRRFQIGALSMALVDLLERNGRRVELTLAIGTCTSSHDMGKSPEEYIKPGDGGSIHETFIKIKKADAPVNLSVLAFALCNASTLRRFGFALDETLNDSQRRAFGTGRSYGYPLGTAAPEGTIVIAGIENKQLSDETSRNRWLQEQLLAQGIEWEA